MTICTLQTNRRRRDQLDITSRGLGKMRRRIEGSEVREEAPSGRGGWRLGSSSKSRGRALFWLSSATREGEGQ